VAEDGVLLEAKMTGMRFELLQALEESERLTAVVREQLGRVL
jgi:hypothetical protein